LSQITPILEILQAYLATMVSLSQRCWTDISTLAQVKPLEKDVYIAWQETPYDKEVFVADGIIRAFYIDDKGNEKNVAFFDHPSFMSINRLRSKEERSVYSFQALTKGTILEFPTDRFSELLDRYPEFLKVAQQVKELEIDRLNKRELCLMETTAEEKVRKFLECYPGFEDRIPHYHIASYLGITPVTLSRVRNKVQ